MPEPESNSPLDRLKAFQRPTKLLIATGVFLLIGAVFFGGCRGVEIPREEAEATAQARIDFASLEPELIESRLLRQGIPASSRWIVVFKVLEPPGSDPKDFLCHGRVYIDAASGDLHRDANFGESSDACPWTLAGT